MVDGLVRRFRSMVGGSSPVKVTPKQLEGWRRQLAECAEAKGGEVSARIRAAALALSLADNQVPPTLGLKDPVLPLHFVTGESIKAKLRHGLLNGISFGGTYATVVISKI